MLTLDSDQTHVLTRAFDRAWANVLRESKGKLTDMQSARELVAKQIVVVAESGERDEWRLARGALLFFRKYQLENSSSNARRARKNFTSH